MYAKYICLKKAPQQFIVRKEESDIKPWDVSGKKQQVECEQSYAEADSFRSSGVVAENNHSSCIFSQYEINAFGDTETASENNNFSCRFWVRLMSSKACYSK